MTREERIVLDPAELATGGRAELDLHSGPIQVRENGVDWGQAEVEAFMAQHELGESPVDFRLPNRVITIPLMLGAEGDYDAARLSLQAKVSRINEEGGWLKRELIGGSYGEAGGHLFCDLVKATLKYGGSTFAARNGVDPDAELVLEALPDFYGDLVEESLFEGTGDATATFQIKGNLPGRVDLAAYEESGKDQRGLAWAFRCRNYSAAPSARLAYDATALHPLDQASVTALAGAYGGGNAIAHTSLGTDWTPVLDNTMSGVYPTHVGLYDVWARVYTTSSETPWLRFVYDVGDLIAPTENDPVRVPVSGNFHLVNLGQVNLREVPIGTHRWIGVLQARGETGGLSLSVDRIWYLPADEGSGVLRAPLSHAVGIGEYKARDLFKEREGSLTGRTADFGGTYVALANSDTTDFKMPTFPYSAAKVERTAVSDTGTITGSLKGRAVGLPVAMAATAFSYGFSFTGDTTKVRFGQMVRASAANKFILVYFERAAGSQVLWLPRVWRQNGVTGGLIYAQSEPVLTFGAGTTVEGRLLTVAMGEHLAVLATSSSTGEYEAVLSLQNPDLGGALSSGDIYIYDENSGAGASTRYYSNLMAWVPGTDAVIFADRDARLTSKGLFRRSVDGLSHGEVSYPLSDLPRAPFGGSEERPVEVIVKPSRGDFESLPDNGIDKVAARLAYRPCWSNIPE